MINHSNYSNKFDNQRVMWLGTPGTWNLFGINLPDFGFTEAFGSSKPGGGGGSIFQNPKIRYSSPPKTSTQSFPKPPPSYTPPSVLGTSTSTTTVRCILSDTIFPIKVFFVIFVA